MASPDPPTTPAAGLRMPLRMDRIAFEKVWGGRALERVPGIPLEIEGPVGETWELVDRVAENSTVRGGPHDGQALRELMAVDRDALLGAGRPTADGRFPVLIKYLHAAKPLSVQVHPDDRTARQLHAGESGKTESWYILDAEPGSLIYLGLREGVDSSDLASIASGPGLVDALQPWPVEAGQFVHVPAGTLHAIGEGITLVEVQQNSDVTYRLYDWGRAGLDGEPRETHVDEGLLAICYEEPIEGPKVLELQGLGGDNRCAALHDGEHYGMTLYELGSRIELDTRGMARAVVAIDGELRLRVSASEDPWEVETGDTWLLPAAVGAYSIEPAKVGGAARVLLVDTKS